MMQNGSLETASSRPKRHSEPLPIASSFKLLKKDKLNNRRHDVQRSYIMTRKTVARFRRRLVFFDSEDMCLCGLLNISHSVHLIACIEIFFSLVLLMQAPDLLTMNGNYFYFLGLFEGGGLFFFVLHVLLSATCLLTAILLYIGSRTNRSSLILSHVLWQFSFIIISISSIIILMSLGVSGRMLLPSSIVLSCMISVAGGCEVWWCLLSLAHYRHIQEKRLNENEIIDDNKLVIV